MVRHTFLVVSYKNQTFRMATALNSFVEPCFLVYGIEAPLLDKAIERFKASLPFGQEDQAVVARCAEQRVRRNSLQSNGANATVCTSIVNSGFTILISISRQTSFVLDIARSKSTHWRYAIFALRCLRTLIRRDTPTTKEHLAYFLEKAHDDHPSLVCLHAPAL